MIAESLYLDLFSDDVKGITESLQQVCTADEAIDEMYAYAITGGRRSRPLLVLVACHAVGGNRMQAWPGAVAIELLHKASLIHDDLVDGDEYRRGRDSFHRRFGTENAVIAGDLLVGLAFKAMEPLSEVFPSSTVLQCYQLLTHIFQTLCIGELIDISSGKRFPKDEEQCLEITYRKTAVLLEGALRLGAILGGGTEEEIQVLGSYGMKVGLAFQLLNDINNIIGLEQAVGRSPGSDILQRRYTLLIHNTLVTAQSDDRERLLDILGDPEPSAADIRWVRKLMIESGSLAYVQDIIQRFLQDAQLQAEKLKETEAKRLLISVSENPLGDWYWLAG